jgi:hypothetical protein
MGAVRKIKPYPATTGLNAMHGAFTALLQQARNQLSDREYVELLALLTNRVAAENARVLPFRLRQAA